ncbi:MAG: hypothetical protein ACTHL8_03510 [Burkholderiaceae bacterium]
MTTQRHLYAIGATTLAFALSGCGTMELNNHNLRSFAYTPGDHEQAVVIISGGSQTSCAGNPTAVEIQAVEDHSHFNIKGLLGFNGVLEKSMYPDHAGALGAFRLEPGDYRVFPWGLNAMNKPTRVPEVDFTVKAGEVVYLGELYMDFGCALKNRVSFNDQFDRDLALLRQLNPALAAAPFEKRILQAPHAAEVY